MLFNIQNMCERRIEIILERFEVKIDGNSCKNRSMLHIGKRVSGKSLSNGYFAPDFSNVKFSNLNIAKSVS